VLSQRAIGEGHISSITFRSGVVDADGAVALDDIGLRAESGERRQAVYERRHFADKLGELGADVGLTARVLDRLPRHFGSAELEQALRVLDELPRAVTQQSADLMSWLAASNYLLSFDPASALSERLIWPEGPFESRGMEDARFVRFTERDGSTTYYATYTAFNGFEILPQLIETNDFTSSRSPRWPAAARRTRAWRCSRARSTGSTSRCRGRTGRTCTCCARRSRARGPSRRCCCAARSSRGRRSRWATAARRSRPTRAGWC
jgi:hypothetical protein